MAATDELPTLALPRLADLPPARLRTRIRQKLPEILIEAGSIVLALLLAFAVDEWRERRSQLALAEHARQAILAELDANRKELRGTYAANAETLKGIPNQIAALGNAANPDGQIGVGMNLSQLSAAALQAAQNAQAAQFLDFDWLVRVGRTYELQRTYVVAQDSVLIEVGGVAGAIAAGAHPRVVLQGLESRLGTLQDLADGLLVSYDRALVE